MWVKSDDSAISFTTSVLIYHAVLNQGRNTPIEQVHVKRVLITHVGEK